MKCSNCKYNHLNREDKSHDECFEILDDIAIHKLYDNRCNLRGCSGGVKKTFKTQRP